MRQPQLSEQELEGGAGRAGGEGKLTDWASRRLGQPATPFFFSAKACAPAAVEAEKTERGAGAPASPALRRSGAPAGPAAAPPPVAASN